VHGRCEPRERRIVVVAAITVVVSLASERELGHLLAKNDVRRRELLGELGLVGGVRCDEGDDEHRHGQDGDREQDLEKRESPIAR
jgi:hypothetical protein